MREEQGVAVRRRLRGELRSDIASCSGAIFHDDLLPEHLSEAVRDEPAHGVRITAGRAGNQDAHRLARIALRPRGARKYTCKAADSGQGQDWPTVRHGVISGFSL